MLMQTDGDKIEFYESKKITTFNNYVEFDVNKTVWTSALITRLSPVVMHIAQFQSSIQTIHGI